MWDPKRLYEPPSTPVVRDAPRPERERPKVSRSRAPGTNARLSSDPTRLQIQIAKMLESAHHRFAEKTLRGILESVTRHGYVTERQFVAVQNIQEAGDKTWRS